MIRKATYIVFMLVLSVTTFAQTTCQDSYFVALNYADNNQLDSAILLLDSQTECSECQRLKAEIYVEREDFFKATAIYKNLTKVYPSDSYLRLSVIYADLGFADESVAYLEKYFELPNPVSYSDLLSNKEFEQINTSDEWRTFWSENRYSNNDLQLEEAEYLIKSEDYNSALDILNKLNYSAKKECVSYLKAVVYWNYDNVSEALKYIQTTLDAHSDYMPALILKRGIEFKNHSYHDALSTNSILQKIDIYNPEHIYWQAELLFLNNESAEAQKVIDIYLSYFPKDEAANYLNTQILIKSEDYREALIRLNKMIEINPSNSDYFVERADIYYLLESWRFASNDYSMALDINPKLNEVWFHYGMCQYNLNNIESACNAWRRAAGMKNRDAVKMLFKECGI